MPLVNFQPLHSYTTFARSATFPKSTVVVARERVRQVAGHLARSNTMASMCSKEEVHESEPPKTTTASQKQAANTDSEKKTAAKKCPTCDGSGSIEAQEPTTQPAPKGAAVDIDQEVKDIYNQLPPLPSPLPKAHPEFVHALPPVAPIYRKFSVFTAGSIEMGAAVQWQRQLATVLSPLPITVCNPRRGHWDPTVTPEAKDESFRQQVEWELGALEQADVICFFFDVNTKSPVTLLELGLWAASEKVIVCCDKRYWRAGNVHIVCGRYKVPFVESFADLAPAIEAMLKKKGMQLDGNGDLIGPNEHVPKTVKKTVLGG
ncbi:uncharacterized protein K460DRAFT_416980 [Cucurbitaria berberidis CBS 394.84]|uniref:Nucleoside 2-deoxyribosyltransferase n=1 Tax=Cucurbitaria berberidis CBS 394.84 TaxID=1168544 RepID=A0A9P4GHK9_9PLEO|nr:uncharacterized protein K460DRAFT_416980 [Cucurbitaria berberidis CBS 394.84]KAF1845777.1 hypothetical protein K460DRAFT_416980 [Cucurbitaria berberidis CBS 394.84]